MQTATAIQITHLTEATELFCRYPGETQQQPCVLVLDLEDGDLSARYNPEIGNAVPASVYHRHVLWLDMPCLTADAANMLLDEAKALAERILAGASIDWDGNNHVGQLDDDADAAEDELRELIDSYGDASVVTEVDAGDWYGAGDDPTEDLGITANTTDGELDAIERTAEAEITAAAEGTVVVTGLDDYLAGLRDAQRTAARDELKQVADERDRLTARRNTLICQVAAWDVDSDRAIGALAGMSHTAVQKIVAAAQRPTDPAMSTFLATVDTGVSVISGDGTWRIAVDECGTVAGGGERGVVATPWARDLTAAEIEDRDWDALLAAAGWTVVGAWAAHDGYWTADVTPATA